MLLGLDCHHQTRYRRERSPEGKVSQANLCANAGSGM
jgi:hypothetical protein